VDVKKNFYENTKQLVEKPKLAGQNRRKPGENR
jgi:hypothetical protein